MKEAQLFVSKCYNTEIKPGKLITIHRIYWGLSIFNLTTYCTRTECAS